MELDCRAACATVLSQVLSGKSLGQVLPPMLERVKSRDRGLLQQLCYGTLRDFQHLEGLLQALLTKPLKAKDRDIQALLLAGLYQLNNTRIPDHAAVAATVDATRVLKKAWARGLSNAVLRRYLRERDKLEAQLSPAQQAAHPSWLYSAIHQAWPDDAGQVIAANNEQPPLTLRVNRQRSSRDDYLEILRRQDIAATPGTLSPDAIYLQQGRDVSSLPGFDEGLVSVQDEAAQLAAIVLEARPGEHILDACAAPGGKSCHILEQQPDIAALYAADIDEQRLLRVSENLERLQLSAELLTMDGSQPGETLLPGSLDRILVDAPCSASGVIRRHPDIKLLRRAADIPALARQQLAILGGLWPLLKPTGTLLYVTCSVLPEENDKVIHHFLEATPDAQLLALDTDWGLATETGRQLLPKTLGPDGLFFARLKKSPG